MAFTITAFRSDDAPRMDAARHIRQVVFCDEQGVSAADEWDGKDHACEHFLLTDNGAPIGTARVRIYGPGMFKVERVAVLKNRRGGGAGLAIMDFIMARLKAAQPGAVVLNAQVTVEDFYRRLGFVSEGELFDEAGIAHVHMVWRP